MRKAAAFMTIALLAGCSPSGDGNNASTAAGAGGAPAGGSAAGVAALQPGQWEVTMQVDAANMPNLPAGVTVPQMQPMTTTICITPEMASNPGAESMGANAQQSGCRTEDFSFSNGAIQGRSICETPGGTVRTTFTGQYSPTSYEMTAQTESSMGGTASNSATRINARRIGDCPAR